MMTIQQLTERINKIIESQKTPGITLWGGYRDLVAIAETLGGEVIEVAPRSGCTSETCRHNSHDPAAPTYKWVPPKEARLASLGGEMDGDGDYIEWFAAFCGDGDIVRFIRTRESTPWYGSAQIVDAESVPEWALLELGREE